MRWNPNSEPQMTVHFYVGQELMNKSVPVSQLDHLGLPTLRVQVYGYVSEKQRARLLQDLGPYGIGVDFM
jgi:hypothetical protein